MRTTVLFLMMAVMALSACSPNAGAGRIVFGETVGLSTTGNLRIISERRRHGMPVVCTEPSPDYAIAFGSARKAKLDLPGPTPASGRKVEGELTSTEAVSLGEGRDAAVLALRDGLYNACQSYANGVIGHDAYAMILSQYGALLVALVGNGAERQGAAATSIGTQNATISALTVACVSSHDRSRGVATNALLTTEFCRRVFERAMAPRR